MSKQEDQRKQEEQQKRYEEFKRVRKERDPKGKPPDKK